MAESKDFSAEAGSAKVSGTVSSTDIAEPIAPPIGLRAMGPRITFHFVGEWDAETSYVLYDVVRVSGTSYIGNKINIAKGINPETDNEVHWVKWNDPNAQVELLQQIVNGFDGRITEVETEATAASADAAAAKKASADNAASISAEVTRAKAAEAANTSAIEGANAQIAQSLAAINQITVFKTPEDYGAAGDGIADDTTAVQAALNSGYPVFLKNKYLIDTVTMPESTVLYGNSANYPTVASTDFDLKAKKINVGATCKIVNLNIKQHDYTTSDVLLDASNAPRISIIGCNFSDFGTAFQPRPTDYWAGENIVAFCTFQHGDTAIAPLVGDCYYINCICTSTVRCFISNLSGSSFMALCHDYSREGTRYRDGARAVSNYIDTEVDLKGSGLFIANNSIQTTGIVFNCTDSLTDSYIGNNNIVIDNSDPCTLISVANYFTNNKFINNFVKNRAQKVNYNFGQGIYNCITNCIPLLDLSKIGKGFTIKQQSFNHAVLEIDRSVYTNLNDETAGSVRAIGGGYAYVEVYTYDSARPNAAQNSNYDNWTAGVQPSLKPKSTVTGGDKVTISIHVDNAYKDVY